MKQLKVWKVDEYAVGLQVFVVLTRNLIQDI